MSRSIIMGKRILGAIALAAAAVSPAAAQIQEPCGVSALCLEGGRYQFIVFWYDADSTRHVAGPVSLSDESGYFWFFNSANMEITVKALDGCLKNGHEWLFISGMTTLRVDVRVTDVLTGMQKDYRSPGGAMFQPVADTTTFFHCPGSSEGPVAGSWTGQFTSADFIDCDPPARANATFEQSGSTVTGTFDAPNVFCGPRHVQFSGLLTGDTLTGTVTGFDYGNEPYQNARAFGTLTESGTQLNLTIANGWGLIPGGVLQLHR
jgi:hypothetical protein